MGSGLTDEHKNFKTKDAFRDMQKSGTITQSLNSRDCTQQKQCHIITRIYYKKKNIKSSRKSLDHEKKMIETGNKKTTQKRSNTLADIIKKTT